MSAGLDLVAALLSLGLWLATCVYCWRLGYWQGRRDEARGRKTPRL